MENKKIKKLVIVFIVFFAIQLQSQQKENYSAIRLIIENNKSEILMRKTKYGWMTPAINHKTRQTQKEVLDSLSSSYGIKITDLKLTGVFTYKYSFVNVVSTRLFYGAKFKSGAIKSSGLNEEVFWLTKKDALAKLGETVKSLKLMTNQVLTFPNTLWGGAFLLHRDKQNNLISRQLEGFYSLRN